MRVYDFRASGAKVPRGSCTVVVKVKITCSKVGGSVQGGDLLACEAERVDGFRGMWSCNDGTEMLEEYRGDQARREVA